MFLVALASRAPQLSCVSARVEHIRNTVFLQVAVEVFGRERDLAGAERSANDIGPGRPRLDAEPRGVAARLPGLPGNGTALHRSNHAQVEQAVWSDGAFALGKRAVQHDDSHGGIRRDEVVVEF